MILETKPKTPISSFGKLIVKLVNSINEKTITSEEEVYNMLTNCDMEHDENVPDWLFYFFDSLLQRKHLERVHYKNSDENPGDVYCFLIKLESIMEGDWDNYGEDVIIIFPKLNLKAYISFESRAYYIQAVCT